MKTSKVTFRVITPFETVFQREFEKFDVTQIPNVMLTLRLLYQDPNYYTIYAEM